MVELATQYIVVIVLGSVLLLLVGVFLALLCLVMKRRRALCFRREDRDHEPFILPDKKMEERLGRKGLNKEGTRGLGNKEKPKTKGGAKARSKARPGGSPGLRKPRGDPFAHNYLSNPLVEEEEMNTDWSNPVFDIDKSRSRDAAICIQSWYRMIRY